MTNETNVPSPLPLLLLPLPLPNLSTVARSLFAAAGRLRRGGGGGRSRSGAAASTLARETGDSAAAAAMTGLLSDDDCSAPPPPSSPLLHPAPPSAAALYGDLVPASASISRSKDVSKELSSLPTRLPSGLIDTSRSGSISRRRSTVMSAAWGSAASPAAGCSRDGVVGDADDLEDAAAARLPRLKAGVRSTARSTSTSSPSSPSPSSVAWCIDMGLLKAPPKSGCAMRPPGPFRLLMAAGRRGGRGVELESRHGHQPSTPRLSLCANSSSSGEIFGSGRCVAGVESTNEIASREWA